MFSTYKYRTVLFFSPLINICPCTVYACSRLTVHVVFVLYVYVCACVYLNYSLMLNIFCSGVSNLSVGGGVYVAFHIYFKVLFIFMVLEKPDPLNRQMLGFFNADNLAFSCSLPLSFHSAHITTQWSSSSLPYSPLLEKWCTIHPVAGKHAVCITV